MITAQLAAIKPAEIRKSSGFEIPPHSGIDTLREGFFVREEISVAGEAPKDFLRIYEYGRGRKSQPNGWPAHIAKVGQKFYPNESVTEQLLTRIGQLLKLNMAKSKLMWVRGQLRFLSEYFLRRDESLVHGAEIFAGYLADDKNFVLQVEANKMSNEIFTFRVVEEAMRSRFPTEADAILMDFVRLIGFDAVVGNNDRHFFNWGVITQIYRKRPPVFSPIYDTARALFWNTDEAGLTKFEHPSNFEQHIRKYAQQCYPKTGWDGLERPNHFELIQKIFEERPMYREVLSKLNVQTLPNQVERLISEEFDHLFSPLRKKFILSCLRERLGNFAKIVVS